VKTARLVVAITEGPGFDFGVRLLERLHDRAVEIHLVVRDGVRRRLLGQGGEGWEKLRELAHRRYDDGNLAARIASGSFVTRGMIVAPCSPSCLAGIATGFGSGLVERAADVTLKEARPLVLLVDSLDPSRGATDVRSAREAGAVVLTLPGPGSVEAEAMIDQIVERVVDAPLSLSRSVLWL
jgi:4-hydroxy-3-polyprenylbenzoate decarboxylase